MAVAFEGGLLSMSADASHNPSIPGPLSGQRFGVYVGRSGPADWPEHSHGQIEILVLLGDAECNFAWWPEKGPLGRRHLKAGQICLIDSNRPHAAVWPARDADLAVIHLAPAFALSLASTPVEKVVVYDVAELAECDLLILELTGQFLKLCGQRAPLNPAYLEGLGIVFASHVLKAHTGNSNKAAVIRGLTPAQLTKAKEFIQRNLKKKFAVGEIAGALNMSEFHFIRLFRRSTKQTPKQYVIYARVIRADELLRAGNLRLSEIAYEVGFCDQSHLDRHYKRIFGISPGAARKQYLAQ